MMSGPAGITLSAALSCYDAREHVGAQLDSLLTQTRLPDEIVVGDAGSTDGSQAVVADAIARARAEALPVRWVVLPSERHLVDANMARIYAACSGDVVVVCDDDDVCLPGRFADVAELFTARPDVLLAHCEAEIIDADGAVTSSSLFRTEGLTPAELELYRAGQGFRVLVRRFLAHGATTALRRTLVELVPPVPATMHADAWYALLAGAMGGLVLEERPGLRYRTYPGNSSGGVRRRSRREKLAMLMAPGGRRNERLLARARALVDGLDAVRPLVADWAYELAQAKLRHETARAAYPRHRVARAPFVVREAALGAYSRFGRGRKDVLLDLVQPAG